MDTGKHIKQDAVFQQAQEIFTQLEPEVIYMVLSEYDFNLDEAMESLFMLGQGVEEEKSIPKSVDDDLVVQHPTVYDSSHGIDDFSNTFHVKPLNMNGTAGKEHSNSNHVPDKPWTLTEYSTASASSGVASGNIQGNEFDYPSLTHKNETSSKTLYGKDVISGNQKPIAEKQQPSSDLRSPIVLIKDERSNCDKKENMKNSYSSASITNHLVVSERPEKTDENIFFIRENKEESNFDETAVYLMDNVRKSIRVNDAILDQSNKMEKFSISVISYIGIGDTNGIRLLFCGNKSTPDSIWGIFPVPKAKMLFHRKSRNSFGCSSSQSAVTNDEISSLRANELSFDEKFLDEDRQNTQNSIKREVDCSNRKGENKFSDVFGMHHSINCKVDTDFLSSDDVNDAKLVENVAKTVKVPETFTAFESDDKNILQDSKSEFAVSILESRKEIETQKAMNTRTAEIEDSRNRLNHHSVLEATTSEFVVSKSGDSTIKILPGYTSPIVSQYKHGQRMSNPFVNPPNVRRIIPPVESNISGSQQFSYPNTMQMPVPVFTHPSVHLPQHTDPTFTSTVVAMDTSPTQRKFSPSFVESNTSRIKNVYNTNNNQTPIRQNNNMEKCVQRVVGINHPVTTTVKQTTGYVKPHMKIMYILRGLPGSGKSTLARKLVGRTGLIFSTDDYFIRRGGEYHYNQMYLGDAHEWNQRRVKRSVEKGISPVIVDNTNMTAWEMKPYAEIAIRNCYQVEINEPNTVWKFKPGKCAQRNTHYVPIQTIRKMLLRYEHNVTVEQVLKSSKYFQPIIKSAHEVSHIVKTPQRISTSKQTTKSLGPNNDITANKFPESISSKKVTKPDINASDIPVPDTSMFQCNPSKNEQKNTNSSCDSPAEIPLSSSTPKSENLLSVSHESIKQSQDQIKTVQMNEIDSNVTSTMCTIVPNKLIEGKVCESLSHERLESINDEISTILNTMHSKLPSKKTNDHQEESKDNIMQFPKSNKLYVRSPSAWNPNTRGKGNNRESNTKRMSENCNEYGLISAGDVNEFKKSEYVSSPATDKMQDFKKNSSLHTGMVSQETLGSRNGSVKKEKNTKSSAKKIIIKENQKQNRSSKLAAVFPIQSTGIETKAMKSTLQNSGSNIDVLKLLENETGDENPFQKVADTIETDFSDFFEKPEEKHHSDKHLHELISSSAKKTSVFSETINCSPIFDVSSSTNEKAISSQERAKKKSDLDTCELTFDEMPAATHDSDKRLKVLSHASKCTAAEDSFRENELAIKLEESYAGETRFKTLTLGLSEEFIEHLVINFGGLGPNDDLHGNEARQLEPLTVEIGMELAREIHELWMKQHQQNLFVPENTKKKEGSFLRDVDQMGQWEIEEYSRLLKQYEEDEELAQRLQNAEDFDERNEEIQKRYSENNRNFDLKTDENTSSSFSSPSAWNIGNSHNKSAAHSKSMIEIMKEEAAAQESEQRQREENWETSDLATQLKRKQLHEMYPGLPVELLDDIFIANSKHLESSAFSVNCLWLDGAEPPSSAMSDQARKMFDSQALESTPMPSIHSSAFKISEPMIRQAKETGTEKMQSVITPDDSYEMLRVEANLHKQHMEEAFCKAGVAYQQKKRSVSTYYAHQGHMHRMKFKEANKRAADIIYQQKNAGRGERSEVDLHGLHVGEAIATLSRKLNSKNLERKQHLYIITGRGSNSQDGVPKIKNAVIEWLETHDFEYRIVNAGMLKINL